jgi:hypothetical protein
MRSTKKRLIPSTNAMLQRIQQETKTLHPVDSGEGTREDDNDDEPPSNGGFEAFFRAPEAPDPQTNATGGVRRKRRS